MILITSDNANDIVFTIKDTKLYVPVVTLSARDNQKLSKLLSKGFEKSVYCNEYKTKSENKNTTNENMYFLESNFVGVNRLFVPVYTNEGNNATTFIARNFIYQNYSVITNGKNFYDQAIDSDIKRYENLEN